MVLTDEYFYNLVKKILKSYDIMKNLQDSKDDLYVLDVELLKINGLLKVLQRKSEEFVEKNPNFSKLQKKIKLYFENYYFIEELEKIKDVYSEDPLRIKNIKNSIITSLENDKLIYLIGDFSKSLK
jgi:hypothetical protein